jgi:hypothetical protein
VKQVSLNQAVIGQVLWRSVEEDDAVCMLLLVLGLVLRQHSGRHQALQMTFAVVLMEELAEEQAEEVDKALELMLLSSTPVTLEASSRHVNA